MNQTSETDAKYTIRQLWKFGLGGFALGIILTISSSRRDCKSIENALQKASTIERSLNTLSNQIERHLANDPTPAPTPPAPGVKLQVLSDDEEELSSASTTSLAHSLTELQENLSKCDCN